jgi:hypothetical protein
MAMQSAASAIALIDLYQGSYTAEGELFAIGISGKYLNGGSNVERKSVHPKLVMSE